MTIRQIIEEQKNAEEMLKHRLLPSNRLLLCGPPGCGKTMTALAIGNALGLKIAYVRLDGLVSSYLGQTSTNLRKVFDAVKNQRVILFLDEFDSIAKKRDDSNELGELKRGVTTLLQNFDSMPSNVLLIAATNHEHLLDSAIWRRFNVTITLGLPDAKQRQTLMEKWFGEYDKESLFHRLQQRVDRYREHGSLKQFQYVEEFSQFTAEDKQSNPLKSELATSDPSKKLTSN